MWNGPALSAELLAAGGCCCRALAVIYSLNRWRRRRRASSQSLSLTNENSNPSDSCKLVQRCQVSPSVSLVSPQLLPPHTHTPHLTPFIHAHQRTHGDTQTLWLAPEWPRLRPLSSVPFRSGHKSLIMIYSQLWQLAGLVNHFAADWTSSRSAWLSLRGDKFTALANQNKLYCSPRMGSGCPLATVQLQFALVLNEWIVKLNWRSCKLKPQNSESV